MATLVGVVVVCVAVVGGATVSVTVVGETVVCVAVVGEMLVWVTRIWTDHRTSSCPAMTWNTWKPELKKMEMSVVSVTTPLVSPSTKSS